MIAGSDPNISPEALHPLVRCGTHSRRLPGKAGKGGARQLRPSLPPLTRCLWGSVFCPIFLHLVPIFIFPPVLPHDLNPPLSGSVTETFQLSTSIPGF